ncbi:MAG TPA: cobalamin-binding protein [Gammaproteobacteria bacterium]
MEFRSAGLSLLLFTSIAHAGLAVVDDAGRSVRVDRPAARIVSLAPHATEQVFTAGAGAALVGTVQWSDYPEAARELPRVGDTWNLDLEGIVALRPDLIVAWRSGNSPGAVERLEALGFTVFLSEPASLEAIATGIRRLGVLAGTTETATRAEAAFLDQLARLRAEYAGRRVLRVFYQVWHEPTYTVNGDHLISRIIEMCGGTNVFAGLGALSPRISAEAVLAADPEVIVASGADAARPPWLDTWREWPELAAVRDDQLHHIPPDLIQRHTARILDGTRQMCRILDGARQDQAGK